MGRGRRIPDWSQYSVQGICSVGLSKSFKKEKSKFLEPPGSLISLGTRMLVPSHLQASLGPCWSPSLPEILLFLTGLVCGWPTFQVAALGRRADSGPLLGGSLPGPALTFACGAPPCVRRQSCKWWGGGPTRPAPRPTLSPVLSLGSPHWGADIFRPLSLFSIASVSTALDRVGEAGLGAATPATVAQPS